MTNSTHPQPENWDALADLADALLTQGLVPTTDLNEIRLYCSRGICAMNDGHEGKCRT